MVAMKTEKFEYVTNAFHELKSPLTTIMLAAEIIKEHHINDDEKDVYATMIINECLRMKNLVCTTINSLENNYFDVDLNQKCDINEILERVAESENVDDIGLLLMASRHNVRGNIGYLESAFRELIENSRKFRSEFPLKINIDTYNDKDKIIIRFSDNGIGMENDVMASVFGKGFHSNFEDKISENQQNTGLGLFFTKRNIQRINGAITVESKKNRGSVFTITLPLIV